MRCAPFVILGLVLGGPASGQATRPPIIDMHLHAQSADQQGPPPMAICPLGERVPYVLTGESMIPAYMAAAKEPPCRAPLWSPKTDDELMRKTLEVLERRSIVAVTSGSPDIVDRWKAAPRLSTPSASGSRPGDSRYSGR